jgi:GT2 family glycosyltransferase
MRSKASHDFYVSIIIIDYKTHNPYLVECLEGIRNQSYKHYEVILVTDYKTSIQFPKIKQYAFNRYASPAEKRDHGAQLAKGNILAFIDDDAYPEKNWLNNIIDNFSDKKVAAVGGPGFTPPRVSWQETVSGLVSASPLGSGPYAYRFLPLKKQFVEDYPSMNLSIKKCDFLKVGGFDSHYWPGEDTKLCLDLVYKLGKKIAYEPKALVYHHRRPLWRPHLRQNGNFGLHRGFFAKVLPETSFKPIYFLPSLLPIGLLILPLSYLSNFYLVIILRQILIVCYSLYGLCLIINGLWILHFSKNIFYSLISIPATILTHFWYGLRFLQGLILVKSLKR